MKRIDVAANLVRRWGRLSESQRRRIMKVVEMDRITEPEQLARRTRFVHEQLGFPILRPVRAWQWLEQKIDYARPIILGALFDERGEMQAGFACAVALACIAVIFGAWARGIYHDTFLAYMQFVETIVTRDAFIEAFALSFGFTFIWGTPLMFIAVFSRMLNREFGKLTAAASK